MGDEASGDVRYFTSYSGIRLPLKPVGEIAGDGLDNRNTFFRGWFDEHERLRVLEKVVYSELELRHAYDYHPNGALQRAEVTDVDGEVAVLRFAEDGQPLG